MIIVFSNAVLILRNLLEWIILFEKVGLEKWHHYYYHHKHYLILTGAGSKNEKLEHVACNKNGEMITRKCTSTFTYELSQIGDLAGLRNWKALWFLLAMTSIYTSRLDDCLGGTHYNVMHRDVQIYLLHILNWIPTER